jgi:hypothetical protein
MIKIKKYFLLYLVTFVNKNYEQLLLFRYFVTIKKGIRQSNTDLI